MLDITRPVETFDGDPARIICSDLKGLTPEPLLAVAIMDEDGAEHLFTHKRDGTPVHGGLGFTLVNRSCTPTKS